MVTKFCIQSHWRGKEEGESVNGVSQGQKVNQTREWVKLNHFLVGIVLDRQGLWEAYDVEKKSMVSEKIVRGSARGSGPRG